MALNAAQKEAVGRERAVREAPQKVAEQREMEEHQGTALWAEGTADAKAPRGAVPAGSRTQGDQCAESGRQGLRG